MIPTVTPGSSIEYNAKAKFKLSGVSARLKNLFPMRTNRGLGSGRVSGFLISTCYSLTWI